MVDSLLCNLCFNMYINGPSFSIDVRSDSNFITFGVPFLGVYVYTSGMESLLEIGTTLLKKIMDRFLSFIDYYIIPI